MKARHWPYTFIICSILGIACLIVAMIVLTGLGASLHPLLADDGTVIFMAVSAITFFLIGVFSLILRRLAQQDQVKA